MDMNSENIFTIDKKYIILRWNNMFFSNYFLYYLIFNKYINL